MKPLRILHTEAATSFGGQEQYIFRMMRAMRLSTLTRAPGKPTLR